MNIAEEQMPGAYESIVHMIPDIIYKLDADGCFTYINNSIRNLGYEPEDLICKHFSTLIHPEDVDNVRRDVVLARRAGDPQAGAQPKLFDERRTGKRITRDLQVRLVPKDYSIVKDGANDVMASCRVISVGSYHTVVDGDEKEFTGTLGVIKDVVNIKKSQETLLRCIDYYQLLVELSNDIFFVVAFDGTILFSSASIGRILGFDPGEITGENIIDYLHAEDLKGVVRSFWSASRDNSVFNSYCRILNSSEEWRSFDMRGKTAYDENGKTMYVTVIINDITVRVRAEDDLKKAHSELELRVADRTAALSAANELLQAEIENRNRQEAILLSSETKYRTLVNSIDDIVLNIDPEGGILFANPAIQRITGYDQREIIGRNLMEFIHGDDMDSFLSALRQAGASAPDSGTARLIETICQDKELRMIREEGDPIWIELRCRPVTDDAGSLMGFRGIAHDITRRKMIEEEMLRQSKIESLAILAAGIAHDFNNLLTAIIGNISLAKIQMAQTEPNFAILTEAEHASEMAKDLTQQLMTFSRSGFSARKVTPIRNLLEDTAYFVLRGSGIICDFRIADDLWEAEIDRGQISQVIHNIILNARQAMPEGGVITLSAANETIDRGSGLPLRSGNYVTITVEDQGKGIPDDIRSRIFDPYFSTKESGSGLGLAISYSIVKKHDGLITVESKPGEGSAFTVRLPAADSAPADRLDDDRPSPNGGRILIMDDEKIIRDMGERLLGHLGYETVTVADGHEAIDIFNRARQEGAPFDVVVLDLIVPDGFGADSVIGQLKKIDPDVRTVVTSGYADDPAMVRYADHGFTGALAKPFSLEELEQELARIFKK